MTDPDTTPGTAAGRRITITDIAARAGVSTSAVSFALNDKPGVSPETRERILSIARDLRWRPHSAARALSGSRAGSLGLVLNRPARTLGTESFFSDLISGIQIALTGTHIGMNLTVARSVQDEIDTYRDWWSGHRVDGVLVIDPRTDDPRLDVLESIGLPTVVVGSHPSPPNSWPTLWLDDADATGTVLRYLHALGHRRIGHVAGPADLEHTALRVEALREFAGTADLQWSQSLPTDYSADAGAAATRTLLSQRERPSAIIFDNDILAVAGLGVTAEMGVAVPRDISLVSFDDSTMAQLVRPALTTLTRDTVGLGERAARLLLAQLDSAERLPSQAGPPLTLSVRASTARAAHSG